MAQMDTVRAAPAPRPLEVTTRGPRDRWEELHVQRDVRLAEDGGATWRTDLVALLSSPAAAHIHTLSFDEPVRVSSKDWAFTPTIAACANAGLPVFPVARPHHLARRIAGARSRADQLCSAPRPPHAFAPRLSAGDATAEHLRERSASYAHLERLHDHRISDAVASQLLAALPRVHLGAAHVPGRGNAWDDRD
jgi:hypothetical protein